MFREKQRASTSVVTKRTTQLVSMNGCDCRHSSPGVFLLLSRRGGLVTDQ